MSAFVDSFTDQLWKTLPIGTYEAYDESGKFPDGHRAITVLERTTGRKLLITVADIGLSESFGQWKGRLEELCVAKLGLGLESLPDRDYRGYYDLEATPEEVVEEPWKGASYG